MGLLRVVDRLAKKTQRSRSGVVQTAIEELAIKQEFDEVVRRLQKTARRRGIHTDEDVFDRVS